MRALIGMAMVAAASVLAACGSSSNSDAGTGTDAGRDAGGGNTDAGNNPDSGTQGACPAPGTSETRLPACSNGPATALNIPTGCVPSVDGTLHVEEWSDAACVSLGSSGDVTYFKYAQGNLYVAFSATPACGCGMAFAFNPDDSTSFTGDEFVVDVFDDPFGVNGDRGDFVITNGAWAQGTAPAGIDSACLGNQPNPINYEFKVPFSALAIQPGQPHTFGFAVNHPNAGTWPTSLVFPDGGSTLPGDPSSWGNLSSTSNWQ